MPWHVLLTSSFQEFMQRSYKINVNIYLSTLIALFILHVMATNASHDRNISQ